MTDAVAESSDGSEPLGRGRMLRLARHSLTYGLGSVASKLLAIVLLPVYVRYLDTRAYGIADMVLVIDLFAAAIFRLGLQNAMMRFYFQELHATDDHDAGLRAACGVVRTSVALTFVSLLVGVAVLVAAAAPIAGFFLGDATLDEYIWIAAFGMWTSVAYSTVTATLRLQQRPGAFLGLSLANVLTSAVLTLALVTEFKLGSKGLLLGNFLGSFVLIPVALLIQRGLVLPRPTWRLVRPMLAFALPTVPIAIATQGLALVDRGVISRTIGLDALGQYSVATRMAQVALLAVLAIQLGWQPFAFSIRDEGRARRTYSRVFSWFAAGMGWIVVAMSLLADPAVRLLTRPAYYPAADVVPLLAMAAGAYGAYFIAEAGSSRMRRTGWYVAIAFSALAVSLAANLVLVPAWGIVGAGAAALLANIALACGMFWRTARVFPIAWEWGRVVRAGALAVLLSSVAWLLPTGLDVLPMLARVALVASYPVLLHALGFTTAIERARLRQLADGVRRAFGDDAGPGPGPGAGAGPGAVPGAAPPP